MAELILVGAIGAKKTCNCRQAESGDGRSRTQWFCQSIRFFAESFLNLLGRCIRLLFQVGVDDGHPIRTNLGDDVRPERDGSVLGCTDARTEFALKDEPIFIP